MKATIIKIYNQFDDHDSDVEMFRVYKMVELLIEPKRGHQLTLDKGTFYVQRIEQNLKEGKLYLYEKIDIPHYEFWSNKEKFTKKYLPKLLKEDWKLLRGEV